MLARNLRFRTSRGVDENESLRVPATLASLDGDVDPLDLTPGLTPPSTPISESRPRSIFAPGQWRFREVIAGLDAAGRLVDAKFAERRSLSLRNAKPGNEWATSRTLASAYQMMLPGEMAPSQRHAANALRVIINAVGSFSVVDGERMPMESGDVVLAPGGHFHGYGHDGDGPAYWLDCLDIPLTYLLDPMYSPPSPDFAPPIARVVEESPYRFARATIQRGLDRAIASTDGCYGPRILLDTPSMPAIGLHVERLKGGLAYPMLKAGANRIFSIMSGRGRTVIEGVEYRWERGDTIVVPSGFRASHVGDDDAEFVEISDEPLMRFTNGYYLEAR